jgi:hypothetical protein
MKSRKITPNIPITLIYHCPIQTLAATWMVLARQTYAGSAGSQISEGFGAL